MPNGTAEQNLRRSAIRNLLMDGGIATQAQLVKALHGAGLTVTQSSVSRDLRDLGAIKTATGYELPSGDHNGDDEVRKVASLLRGATAAGGNLLVVHTAIGAAQRVALALDRSGWPEIVGNIGGDDTVFVATASVAAQKALATRLDRAIAAR